MKGRRNSPVAPIEQVPPADTSAYRPVVLVVDDEVVIAETLASILSSSGYAAMAAYDANEAIDTALLTPPEMLITDVFLPGMSGIELAITIKRIFPDCRILLVSGQSDTSDLLMTAKAAGHYFTLLTKPVDPRNMLAHVAASLNAKLNSEEVSAVS